jgi:hypothetical protein
VSDQPRRVQRSRRKGWRMPPDTVYVGRPGKWGNPYKVAQEYRSDHLYIPAVTVESAVKLYRVHMEARLQYPAIRAMLEALRGKNLCCWCPLEQPCHADVLLELANR